MKLVLRFHFPFISAHSVNEHKTTEDHDRGVFCLLHICVVGKNDCNKGHCHNDKISIMLQMSETNAGRQSVSRPG